MHENSMVTKSKKDMRKGMRQGRGGARKVPAAALRRSAGRGGGRTKNTGRITGTSVAGIRPLGDRVVIRPMSEDELGTKSPSGIIIPETVKGEKPEQGTVVAVGAGKYEDGERIPLQVVVGDRVVFSKYGYDEVKVAGEEYLIVSEANILAIISK